MNPDLAFENQMVLATVQAFIGAVTPSVSAISISADSANETLDIFVALSAPDGISAALVDDVVTDIEVLTDDAARIEVHTWIGEDWTQRWPGRDRRMIYAAYQR
jgi:hypothetical protein